VDGDRHGPALVLGSSSSSSSHDNDSNDDDDQYLGFLNGLRQFGPTLVQHTQLKVRANMKIPFLLVDSPGMIDAPHQFYGSSSSSSTSPGRPQRQRRGYNDNDDGDDYDEDEDNDIWMMDRGYDFTNVVKWFASRADVVCLVSFFGAVKTSDTNLQSQHFAILSSSKSSSIQTNRAQRVKHSASCYMHYRAWITSY
jgi:hypothetical protein